MIAIDTETTGVDHHHGSRPFIVTICGDETEKWDWPICPHHWEWEVDPLTRKVSLPHTDVESISDLLADVWHRYESADDEEKENHVLVLQHAKFDAMALETIGITNFPWPAVRDTIVAGHLLATNHKHDLYSMVLEYLDDDLSYLEDKMEAACRKARRECRSHFPHWQIAKQGSPSLPSLRSGGKGEKDKGWKFDTWLPKTLAARLGYPKEHEWYRVTSEYADGDSAATLCLWVALREKLKKLGLWRIFMAKMELPPILLGMEKRGVTVSGSATDKMEKEMKRRSIAAGNKMKEIALEYNYDLKLPKGAINNSIRTFVFDYLQLEPVYSKKAKTASPTLDAKTAIPHYLATLDEGTIEKEFISNLVERRQAETAMGFITSYRRFWLPNGHKGWYTIHPTYGQTTTDTTRMSSYNPNSQQISKKEKANLRDCFCPAMGREWWSLDAKNIELRIPSYASGEESLIALFEKIKEPPYYGSLHILNFSIVYDDLWRDAVEKVGIENAAKYCKQTYEDTWYQWAKNGGLAMQYQCGRETADAAFHKDGSYARLKKGLPKMEALNSRCMAEAHKYGWVNTIPVKSVDPSRGYPILASRSEYGDVLPTTPLNYFSQGTAGEWMHGAIRRVEPQLAEWREGGCDCWMILTVHDELVFDFPKGRGDKPWLTNLPKIRKIQSLMEQGGEEIGIPTPVTVEYHAKSWGEGMIV